MLSGDTFRRKLVKLSGPTLSRKKITVQMLDEISAQIQRYLLVQVFTSVLVGITSWLAFLWIGLEHAAVWGIAAAILNLVPYLGAIVIIGGTALVGFLQFESMGMALTVAAISLAIHGPEGNLPTPWLTGRASRMNAVVVFVGVLFWGGVGRVGAFARHADPDGHQVGVRSRRGIQIRRRIHGGPRLPEEPACPAYRLSCTAIRMRSRSSDTRFLHSYMRKRFLLIPVAPDPA